MSSLFLSDENIEYLSEMVQTLHGEQLDRGAVASYCERAPDFSALSLRDQLCAHNRRFLDGYGKRAHAAPAISLVHPSQFVTASRERGTAMRERDGTAQILMDWADKPASIRGLREDYTGEFGDTPDAQRAPRDTNPRPANGSNSEHLSAAPYWRPHAPSAGDDYVTGYGRRLRGPEPYHVADLLGGDLFAQLNSPKLYEGWLGDGTAEGDLALLKRRTFRANETGRENAPWRTERRLYQRNAERDLLPSLGNAPEYGGQTRGLCMDRLRARVSARRTATGGPPPREY